MRPVRLPDTFVFWFIAPDDSAIGEPGKYGEYLKTGDETVLGLKPGVEPAYYFLHPLGDESGEDYRQVTSNAPPEGVKDQAYEFAIECLNARIVSRALCGCLNHRMVVGQVRNKVQVDRVSWEIDTPAPKGLVESLVKDKILCTIIFSFLASRSVLTEDEKN